MYERRYGVRMTCHVHKYLGSECVEVAEGQVNPRRGPSPDDFGESVLFALLGKRRRPLPRGVESKAPNSIGG